MAGTSNIFYSLDIFMLSVKSSCLFLCDAFIPACVVNISDGIEPMILLKVNTSCFRMFSESGLAVKALIFFMLLNQSKSRCKCIICFLFLYPFRAQGPICTCSLLVEEARPNLRIHILVDRIDRRALSETVADGRKFSEIKRFTNK